jgi:methylthioribose-1-phosphate isomerase
VRNPAFDVTPHRYLTAIITERGIARAPYADSLLALASTDDTEAQRTQRGAQRTEDR